MTEKWKPWFTVPLGPFGSGAVFRITDRWYKGKTSLELTVDLFDVAMWFAILFIVTR